VSSYVIRGGEPGKARLRVVSEALESSTLSLLAVAGLQPGMRCLDVGCGGGEVTVAMAHVVGPRGRVVGVDMDAVKIGLARQEAIDSELTHLEFRAGDVSALPRDEMFDVVFARLVLTHVAEPLAVLQRMVAVVAPGGVVVVEDMDHSAVFTHPRCDAMERYVALYDQAARARGGDPEIGPKLPGMLRRAGIEPLEVRIAQPAFFDGVAKGIHRITLENVRDNIISSGLASAEELDALDTAMAAFDRDVETIVSFPRVFQTFGRRAAAPASTV
jgi:SAM-dependent methyltransferase